MRLVKDNSGKLLKALDALKRKSVLVGIPGDRATRKGEPITNAALGYIHEHGSAEAHIPARPFLKPGVEKSEPQWRKALQQAVKLTLDGSADAESALHRAGIIAQNAVKDVIVQQSEGWAPRSESYNKRQVAKGKEKTLIDTGQLLNSIHYVIRDGSD